MNKGEHLIYDHVFKVCVNDGFTQRDSEQGGAEAVRIFRRNTPAKKAIKQAIATCKKLNKRVQ